MKYLSVAFFTLFLFLLPGLKAQQNHFIYIQNETHQAFYVKLDKKLFSSSTSGYVILPKLKDGSYKLTIGFQKTGVGEQNMLCTIDKTDIGFLLKNFGTKGWGLFNLQTLDVIMDNTSVSATNVSVVNKTDAFSNMLSEVVNDSSIRQVETYIVEAKKMDVKEQEKKPAGIAIVQQAPAKLTTTKPIPAVVSASELASSNSAVAVSEQQVALSYSKSTVRLIKKGEDGTSMTFVDETKGNSDTIRVFIPVENLPSSAVVEEKPSPVQIPVMEPKLVAVAKEDKMGSSRFLDIELPVSNGLSVEKKQVPENETIENKELSKVLVKKEPDNPQVKVVHQPLMINSDCKILATEEDFMKLRKKMAAANNDEDMLKIANKSLKAKCYLVEQIKNLSVLFLKDAGRFAFFDNAYPFVFDSHNFGILQNQLMETYYINRFQLMIRH